MSGDLAATKNLALELGFTAAQAKPAYLLCHNDVFIEDGDLFRVAAPVSLVRKFGIYVRCVQVRADGEGPVQSKKFESERTPVYCLRRQP